ncbi:sulfite exporter TauE/SafE family protein [Sphingomonas sp.]|uniref:sulfite exporter TauE/SafE family protein n=1 Tax=Sphingomonas sp. TaxID=28214 RepID=UPI002CDB1D34|nr:sulfite exporter TauE/SafE family protein [Sphingomonas sp.]HTG39592.1 sulfite exporter TauE/SafE family protein [Sphingomonas sp.]
MPEPLTLALAAGAGLLGGAMNALAGGGTFATMPALIAIGLPSPIANATSNVALQPGAIASAWTYRDGLQPIGGVAIRTLSAITFCAALLGSLLLVFTPTAVFDIVIPWLLLLATLAIAFGKRAALALQRHAAPGRRALIGAQVLLGIYGGYFGGGLGLMLTATWGLLAGEPPHRLMAPRTLMLAMGNAAATLMFIGFGMVRWEACAPMLLGAVLGGWLGARVGQRLPAGLIRAWTLFVTVVTTMVFFARAYG